MKANEKSTCDQELGMIHRRVDKHIDFHYFKRILLLKKTPKKTEPLYNFCVTMASLGVTASVSSWSIN